MLSYHYKLYVLQYACILTHKIQRALVVVDKYVGLIDLQVFCIFNDVLYAENAKQSAEGFGNNAKNG